MSGGGHRRRTDAEGAQGSQRRNDLGALIHLRSFAGTVGRRVFVSFNVIQKAKLLRIRSLDDFQFKGIT